MVPFQEHLPEAGPPRECLADLGEWELIRRLSAFAPAGQFNDDAALLAVAPRSASSPVRAADGAGPGSVDAAVSLVVNTDVLVEGLHFSDRTTAAADVGWRAAAANLSDLAAMGATEVLGITVGLVAPAQTTWSWVEGVYQGLSEALQHHGGVLLGGDCSGGAQRLLAITALGRLPAGGGAIRRRDGRPGDQLICTGPHGLSRLGLALLQGSLAGLDPALSRRAIAAHQRPVPRFDAVRALIASQPTTVPWRVGGCDSSDGLAAAAAAIAAASDCAAQLDRQHLPLDAAMATLPEAEAWCLGGGEDFELVLALEPSWAQALQAALPGSQRIGELVAGAAGALHWSSGEPWPEPLGGAGGYRHFG
ncbi:MAG: thiamine-phosphate kinase [Cyanobium sp.]